MLNILEKDLIRAKIIKNEQKLNYLNLIILILIYRIVRIKFLIRLSLANSGFVRRICHFLLWNKYSVNLSKNTSIGPGLLLPHAVGCIINGVLGANVTVSQNVTIGGNFKKIKKIRGIYRKTPIIGNNVWICAGSVIAGPLIIGNNVIIGANATVTKDIPSGKIVINRNKVLSKKIILSPEGSFETIK